MSPPWRKPATQASRQSSRQPARGDWEVLFDGKNLDAWDPGLRAGVWAVNSQGELYPAQPGPNLFTKRRSCDFVLELEFKLAPGQKSNSGVFLRVHDPAQAADTSLEMQILDHQGYGAPFNIKKANGALSSLVGPAVAASFALALCHEEAGFPPPHAVKGRSDWDYVTTFGYQTAWGGSCVHGIPQGYLGYDDPPQYMFHDATGGWMASAPHKANILATQAKEISWSTISTRKPSSPCCSSRSNGNSEVELEFRARCNSRKNGASTTAQVFEVGPAWSCSGIRKNSERSQLGIVGILANSATTRRNAQLQRREPRAFQGRCLSPVLE